MAARSPATPGIPSAFFLIECKHCKVYISHKMAVVLEKFFARHSKPFLQIDLLNNIHVLTK